MNPEYFLNKLTFYEASLFIEGVNRRARVAYENSRLLIDALSMMLGGKHAGITLPWDDAKPQEDDESTDEDIERLQSLMDEKQKQLNNDEQSN